MTGRIDNDVFSLFGFEKAAGRVNRDPLCLLVLQCIQQKGIFKGLGMTGAGGLDIFQFPFRKGTGIGQQPADHRAFSMIDVPDDDNVHLLSA